MCQMIVPRKAIIRKGRNIMSLELMFASGAITLALVFYTIGVFSERRNGSLKLSHLIFFWCGLACDTTGTLLMSNIAATNGTAGFGIHAFTGLLAIVLMLVHAVWATWVYVRGTKRMRTFFHQFSSVVWLVWLVPYIIGLLVGIPMIHLQFICAIGTSIIVVAILAVFMLRPRKGSGHRS